MQRKKRIGRFFISANALIKRCLPTANAQMGARQIARADNQKAKNCDGNCDIEIAERLLLMALNRVFFGMRKPLKNFIWNRFHFLRSL
jgi:hypothetical protein